MVRPRLLKNKPLVEALFEARWTLEKSPGMDLPRDPHYKFLLGKLFDTVRERFPYHEELPLASVPEEFTPNTVHHRFRVAENAWPLLQIGPGVFTVNDTVDYVWTRFAELVNWAVPVFVAAHPKPEALQIETVMLRFLNAIQIDPTTTDLLDFLSEKLKLGISLPDSVFADGTVQRRLVRLENQLVFPCSKPRGALILKFNTGRHNENPAVIFELWFVSRRKDVPKIPEGFHDWVATAHSVIETTFFRFIEGDLEKVFAGDD